MRKAAKVNANEATDTDWQVTATTYTPTRKPWIATDPMGYEAITAYDGDDRATDLTQCLTMGSGSTCPGASRTTHTSYYADGQVNQVFKGWGSADQITYSATTYDKDDKPLSVADANGNVTRSVYDGYGRLFRLCYPDSTAASCTVTGSPADYEQYTSYDLNGNLLTKRNRDGISLNFAYDALNHETTQTVPANLNGHFARTLSSTYDLAGRPWTETADGQTLSMQYDGAKRLGGVTDSLLNALGANIGNMAYSYDAASNRTGAVVYTAGTSWGPTYIYDDAERLTGVNSTSAVATYTLDPLSRRIGETLYGGSSASYAYWPNNDLETLTHTWSGTSLTFGLTENGAHQITGETYSDNSYEMQAAIANTTYAVNSLNQYTSVNTTTSTTPTYDANGNLTRDDTWIYEYDEENRLRTATGISNGHSNSYAYDPQGRRRSKTVDGLTTYFVSDGPNEVAELSSTGARQRLYVYGNGPDDRIAMYTDAGSTWDIYHTDHHGSTVAMVRGDALLTTYRYGPYGESQDDPTGNPFRYTGRYLDAETGLYYYRARYYSPKLGRFLQTDPIGAKDDLNEYAYTGGDPVNGSDPTGLSACDDPFGCPFSADASSSTGGQLQGTGKPGDTGGGVTVTAQRPSGGSSGAAMAPSAFDHYLGMSVVGMVNVNLFLMGGELGDLAEIGGSLGRIFYDARSFPQISRNYWAAKGPAAGRSLHHWLFPQRAKWVPQGIRNSGLNLLELPPLRGTFHTTLPLNTWMGFARNWGGQSAAQAAVVENGIRVGIPLSAAGGGYAGYELGSAIEDDSGQ